MNNNKNKILFIVTQSEFGGAQRFIFELVSRLNKEKYELLVAAGQGDNELFVKLQVLNIKTIQLKHLKRNPNPLKALFSMSEILNLLKKEKPDTLFLCSTTAGILGSIAGSIYKLFKTHDSKFKIIYRIGGWAFHDPRNWLLNQLIGELEKITAGFKDKIIVNSEFDYQTAIKKRICSSDKIVKIHNGIDSNNLHFFPKDEARKRLFQYGNLTIESFNHSIIIGAIANFYRTKGINHLIKAMNLLGTKYEALDVKCIVIGDGNQRPELEKLIKEHGLENKVFLVGRIPNAYRYLKAFDVFVLPSLKEGFPWIILETMSAEVPIIATKVGALPEIIKNYENGILIEPKNNMELAEKINELIINHKLIHKLKINAKQNLNNFSSNKMVEKVESLF